MSHAAHQATRLGLVRCEHCQRQFNPHSAARHIPWCKKQQSEGKRQRLTADKLQALERYKWRISYRPSNKIHAGGGSSQAQGQFPRRDQPRTGRNSSVNSSSGATLSSPSASSITSLSNNSITSSTLVSNSKLQANGKRNAPLSSQHQQLKLKRSISSVGLGGGGLKQRGEGSASSKNSRISTTTTTIRALEPSEFAGGGSGGGPRAKSVSDLARCAAPLGELVESLAKRMEQLFAQNQLLLESLTAGNNGKLCDKQQQQQQRVRGTAGREEEEALAGEEFDQCHHCRAKCLVEANYCHKCGCKMRPANPTPPHCAD